MTSGMDTKKLVALSMCAALWAYGCDGGDGGTDAGPPPVDTGPPGCPTPDPLSDDARPETVTCPDTAPNPGEQMGTCCWRHSNADQLATPELRISYIQIVQPIGSPLATTTVARVLNESIQDERFNWLIRGEGSEGDGPVTITTGFGRRATDGTYEFSQGSAGTEGDPDTWCPVELDGNVASDVVTTPQISGSITVPIFDETGEELQIELTLRDIALEEARLGENRSCIGWKHPRPFSYVPQAVLTGWVELEGSREQVISVPGVETTVCSALAGELSLTYCDTTPQTDWSIKPDSLCDASGCQTNTPCESDVCDPATTCNAWRFVAQFAASGVDITNGLCGG